MLKNDNKKRHIVIVGKGGGGGGTQVQSDWAQTDNTQPDYIKNKPEILDNTWFGTQTEFDALAIKDPDIIYYIEDTSGIPDYFYIEDISGSDNTLSIVKNNTDAPTIEVFKSTDSTNWESMGTTDTTAITATIPANGKLYLKATANTWGVISDSWGDLSAYNMMICNNYHNLGGNIMSLIYSDNFENQTEFPNDSSGNFAKLFSNNTKLISAFKLILPVMRMQISSYRGMFSDCTSLIQAPALPATTLNNSCYRDMFNGCTGLTTAPALPATTMVYSCYRGMFNGCTGLTTAPALPATTLATYCYIDMFRKCSSLNSVTTYATSVTTSQLSNWLRDVPSTGDFYNLGGATYTRDESGIPSGWTEHTSL